MRRRYLGLIAGIMILTAGCSPASTEPVMSAEETAAATEVESQEDVSEVAEETKEEESGAAEESLKEAEESIRATEESLKAMEESLKEVEESLKAEAESAEAKKDNDYTKVVKEPDKYVKKQVRFSGTITRSASVGSASVQIVLAVDGDGEDKVVGEYKRSIVDTNLVVGDEITLSGEFQGMIRYRMQTGGAESLPTVNIEKIENIVKAEPETEAVPFSMPESAQTTIESSAAPESAPGSQGTDDPIGESETPDRTSPVISAGH